MLATFKNRNDVKTTIKKMSVHSIKLTADLPTTATHAEKRRWEKKVDKGTKRELQLEDTILHPMGAMHQSIETQNPCNKGICSNA